MTEFRLPPLQPYAPATFVERGSLVPFTTPFLEGTRARPSRARILELVIPNPSGGQGVYAMNWNGIAGFCRPTLHDRQLSERLAALPYPAPRLIRRIARTVAQEGFAGEEAQRAALRSEKSELNERMLANYRLLMALIDQSGLFEGAPAHEPDIETRGRQAVGKVAEYLGRSQDWVASALEALADATYPLGGPVVHAPGAENIDRSARIPRLAARVRELVSLTQDWADTQLDRGYSSYASMISRIALTTLEAVRETLQRSYDMTAKIAPLLKQWSDDSEDVLRIASQPEWLLDGWDELCEIWACAQGDGARRAAIVEIATMVPVLPREVLDWVVDPPPERPVGRMVGFNHDWRSGAVVFDLIARNEHIRAATC